VSALAFTIVALVLSGPVPAMLARATWPTRAPRAAIVLWQSIALAAVLSAVFGGHRDRQPAVCAGPDGRPTATITSEIEVLGWPLWTVYVIVFAVTLVIGARLTFAVVQVAIATRRRRAHHRMVVDLVGKSQGNHLRILDVAQPLAYCLPGVRSRVVGQRGCAECVGQKRGGGDPQSRACALTGPPRPGSRDVHRRARRLPPVRS